MEEITNKRYIESFKYYKQDYFNRETMEEEYKEKPISDNNIIEYSEFVENDTYLCYNDFYKAECYNELAKDYKELYTSYIELLCHIQILLNNK